MTHLGPIPFLRGGLGLALLISCVWQVARADLVEGPYEYTVTNGETTITRFADKAYAGTLWVTNTLGGSPVTIIDDYAFGLCTALASVIVPEGVTNIGYMAFASCRGLTNASLPESLLSIEGASFNDCIALHEIRIPKNVNSMSVPGHLCPHLTNIAVDAQNANYSSWNGCLFDKARTVLVEYAHGREGGYTVPPGVTNIGDRAFYSSPLLTGVTMAEGVATIGDYAFNTCTSLTHVILPESLAFIGYGAFGSCAGLRTVAIPDGVVRIGEQAFADCAELTTVTLGRRVEVIDTWAFIRCSNLISVVIPPSVTMLGYRAFGACPKLERVYFSGPPPSNPLPPFEAPSVLYRLPEAMGWGDAYSGLPVVLWNPEFVSLGFDNGSVSCTVTGIPGIPITLEVTTNLVTGPWTQIQTTNLAGGQLTLIDSGATNTDARALYYRIAGP